MISFVRRQEGQSLVEFALVIPIFLLLLFGIIEFGRIWETMNTMTGAAREGARVAAVTAPDVSRSRAAALRLLGGVTLTGLSVSVSGPGGSNEVTVTVSGTYVPLTNAIIPGLIGPIPLSRTTTMHWEG
ncbi:MAG TPA: TadE/TadG family type IV pilus assembly protein [bacterium]|nr:TadE/TadG family type IV pilus assembly protein [bacterium]HPG84895.1 TadE/TadG family type IV pilus assembly protein [bacterium]HPM60402.1 TadE/TadG family type IV pilus assembly protein [bacterium]